MTTYRFVVFVAVALLWGPLARHAHADLIHHYPIQNESDGIIRDIIGTADLLFEVGVDGEFSSNTPIGASTQSFSLFDLGSAVTASPDGLFQPDSFTAALWYQLGEGGAGGAPPIFGTVEQAGMFQHNYLFRNVPGGGGNFAFFSRDAAGNTVNLASDTQINNGQWHHIAATFDSSTLEINLYVDGEVTGTTSFDGWSGWTAANQTSSGIGDGTAGRAAPGLYDDIRIYNEALDQQAIQEIMSGVIDGGGMPGDVNGDEIVDIADYAIIRDNFFNNVAGREEGDLNFDGLVDWHDFREWKNNAQLGAAAGSAAVPAPAGVLLALLAAAALLGKFVLTQSGKRHHHGVTDSK